MTPGYVIVQPYIVIHPDSSDPQDDYRNGHTVKADGTEEDSLYWNASGIEIAGWLQGQGYVKIADLMNRHFSTDVDGVYRLDGVQFAGRSRCHTGATRCDDNQPVVIGDERLETTVHNIHGVKGPSHAGLLFGFVHLTREATGMAYRVSVRLKLGESPDWQDYDGFGI